MDFMRCVVFFPTGLNKHHTKFKVLVNRLCIKFNKKKTQFLYTQAANFGMKLLDKTRIIRFIRINHVKLVLTHVFVTQFPWDTILLIYIYSI